MKVTKAKITHTASTACGLTLSLGLIFINIILNAQGIITKGYHVKYFFALIFSIPIFFAVGYLISRILLLFLYPIYLRVSKNLSILIFCLVGAIVGIMPLLLVRALLRSAVDRPATENLFSIGSPGILLGLFGSCCAISAWYVLRKHDPN